MGIHKIKIKNYRSLKNINLDINQDKYNVYSILGKNGTGKSNFIDAINYFYESLDDDRSSGIRNIDNLNPYNESMNIEITYSLDNFEKMNMNPYHKEMILALKPYIRNNKILVKLTEYKDGTKKWIPRDKKIRRYISKLFPIYVIDTRFINLRDWSSIWNIINELSITTEKIEKLHIDKKLDESFKNIYGDKYDKSLKILIDCFERERIGINKNNYNERFKSALFTRLGGNEFINEGKDLNYYSDGINSLKYIKLVLAIVSLLSKNGWKQPMVIIDEPEIGLHPQYTYELVESIISSVNNGLGVLISTHSTELISGLIKNNISIELYRMDIKNNYSIIERIKDIVEEKDKFLVTTKEVECYFSNAIVCVEGKSEMQIFLHPKIRSMFTKLSKVTFYQYNSDNSSIKLISPETMKFTIPYLRVVDMDKILTYSKNKSKFKVHTDSMVNPLGNEYILKKEKSMYFSYEKRKITKLSNDIKKYLEPKKFTINEDLYCLNNPKGLNEFLHKVKCYCSIYDTYPVTTTIEGSIINNNSIDIIIEWMKIEYGSKIDKLEELLQKDIFLISKKNIYYRVNIVRLILNGKSDSLKTLREIEKEKIITGEELKKIKKLNNIIGGKTSGWIIKFINYYFNTYIEKLDNEYQKSKFRSNFNELYEILQKIENMV